MPNLGYSSSILVSTLVVKGPTFPLFQIAVPLSVSACSCTAECGDIGHWAREAGNQDASSCGLWLAGKGAVPIDYGVKDVPWSCVTGWQGSIDSVLSGTHSTSPILWLWTAMVFLWWQLWDRGTESAVVRSSGDVICDWGRVKEHIVKGVDIGSRPWGWWKIYFSSKKLPWWRMLRACLWSHASSESSGTSCLSWSWCLGHMQGKQCPGKGTQRLLHGSYGSIQV